MENRFYTPFDNGAQRPKDPNQLYEIVTKDIQHKVHVQTFRKMYWYVASGTLAGQASSPFLLTITQNKAFDCKYMTGYAFSYDDANASDFPIPNDGGLTAWAGDGLSVRIQSSFDGTEFMNGDIPFKLLFAPGYGINFQNVLPFENVFPGGSTITFNVTNRDNSDRTHVFAMVLGGHLVDVNTRTLTP